MEIFYKHRAGTIEKKFMQVSDIFARNVTDPEMALEKGFLQNDDDLWYNTRSTRVKPTKLKYKRYWDKTTFGNIFHGDIYLRFLKTHGFGSDWYDMRVLEHDDFLEYWKDGELIAFTKIRVYEKSAELSLHAHVSDIPDFAYQTLKYEITEICDGFDYIYLGPGYEKSSLYKSKIDGFEFFDGEVWDNNVERFRKFCYQDYELRT